MDRLAVVEAPDTVGLPATQEAIEDRIPAPAPLFAPSEGELIDVADLEHLRDIPLGERALQLQVVGVSQLTKSTYPFRVGGNR